MFINTNVSALQSVQDLYNTTQSMDNVLEQLSSGYSINSAADNPAGLAITQEMQTQVNGLNQAASNSQAGISLLQTADGAMNNIDTILQSMRSLASQAATGTNNPTDLQALQQEMNQYGQEITNIANTTQFNNLNLLSGAFGGAYGGNYNSDGQYVDATAQTLLQTIQIGANQGQQISIGINPMDAYSLNVAGVNVGTFSAGATSFTGSLTSTAATNTAYLANAGNGLFTATSGSTASSYNVALTGGIGAALDSATYKSGLGEAAPVTIIASTNGTSAGDLLGTFQGADTTTYTVTVTGVTGAVAGSQTITYSITGSDGYSGTGTVTAGGVAATVGFSFTDSVNGSAMTLLSGLDALITSFAVGQTATFAMSPATANLGLFTGSGQLSADLVGTSSTLTGSQLNGGGPLIVGSQTSSSQVTINNLGVLLGATAGGSTYESLVTLGNTFVAGASLSASANFEVSLAGSAADVHLGNGVMSTAATVTSGVNISTQGNAASALTTIDDAITDVNAQRAVIGAYQNELQFAVSNAQTGSTNLSSAQAGILDTNMALQMANLSKYQILQQTGIAMLSQANAMPQALLKLIS